MFSFSISTIDDNVEVNLKGDLDIDGTEIIENELIPSLKQYQRVTVDFKKVPFVDSSGIGLLLHLVQSLKENGTIVKIVNISEEVMYIFELLQISEILGKGVMGKNSI